MNVKTRILAIRLLDEIEQNPAYCKSINVCDGSKMIEVKNEMYKNKGGKKHVSKKNQK